MTRFRWRGAGVALWLFLAAFAGQLALRHLLSARSLLSPDAVLGVSFGGVLALELALRQPVEGLFEVRAAGFHQLQALAAAAGA